MVITIFKDQLSVHVGKILIAHLMLANQFTVQFILSK
jgi:hypothetical protein